MASLGEESVTFEQILMTIKDHAAALAFFISFGLIRPPAFCDCGGKLFRCTEKRTKDGYSFKCTMKECKKTFSARHGSWFKSVGLSLDIVYKLIYCWCYV